MGLKGTFIPNAHTFYFRVRTPKGYTFDIASVQHDNIHDAHASLKKLYPGASVHAIIETEFDWDGLPVLKPTLRREHERATNTGPAR